MTKKIKVTIPAKRPGKTGKPAVRETKVPKPYRSV